FFARWCGEEVRRWGCQIRCHPHHLAVIQNDEIRPKIVLVLLQNGTLMHCCKKPYCGRKQSNTQVNGE
ncbi:hypothetical protein AVEN_272838-1, partial [Araneus ventricosus]